MDGHFDVVDRKIALPQTDATWAELPRPEVTQRTFCDVSTRDHGLMIANRGLPEVAVLSSGDGTAKVSLTLLRCVGWLSREDLWNRKGHAGPGLPTPGAQEIGIHTFEYSVIPHDGNWKVAARQAYAFNTPLDAVATSLHTGSLPAKGSLITCDSPDFVITAVKAAEKDDGWLVRGFNMSDDPIQVILQTGIPFTTASEVFLDESHKRTITPETDGTLKLAVGDHEILSIKFEHA
jgi:alpha-mannosidase